MTPPSAFDSPLPPAHDASASAAPGIGTGFPQHDGGAIAQGGGASKLLGAVSTLLALTPRGRTEELTRLTALAHGYISLAHEEELVTLAKAVAGRDDVSGGLADRLAETSPRAAEVLIRANRLGEEAIAYLLERGDDELRTLIARHHTLQAKHITMLVADGSASVLQALLDNRQTDFSRDAKALVERGVAKLENQHNEAAALAPTQPPRDMSVQPVPARGSLASSPRQQAQDFATLDGAARRAVMHRLAEDTPQQTTMREARHALDPTRNDSDLAFLTVIEQRDPSRLADLFAETLQLDRALVGKLVDESDGDAMIVLAKGAGLSTTAFARLLILSKVGLSGSPRDTFNLVDRFKALPEATAQMILSAMRQGRSNTAPAMAPASAAEGAARRSLPTPAQTTTSHTAPARTMPEAPEAPAPQRAPTKSILALAKERGTSDNAMPQHGVPHSGFRRAV